MKTLVIIDMQKHFSAAKEKSVIKACQREIKRAIKNKEPIIFVEYKSYGRTTKELTDLTKGYKHKYTTKKEYDSGAYQIHKVIVKHKLSRNLRICGVNTDYCVCDTVEDLKEGFPYLAGSYTNITIIADATNSKYQKRTLRYFKKLKLRVIRKAA